MHILGVITKFLKKEEFAILEIDDSTSVIEIFAFTEQINVTKPDWFSNKDSFYILI